MEEKGPNNQGLDSLTKILTPRLVIVTLICLREAVSQTDQFSTASCSGVNLNLKIKLQKHSPFCPMGVLLSYIFHAMHRRLLRECHNSSLQSGRHVRLKILSWKSEPKTLLPQKVLFLKIDSGQSPICAVLSMADLCWDSLHGRFVLVRPGTHNLHISIHNGITVIHFWNWTLQSKMFPVKHAVTHPKSISSITWAWAWWATSAFKSEHQQWLLKGVIL